MNSKADEILDVAQRMIREGGFHAFSFRQIADELAIKSASVHYHYPTKEALGAAVTTRYTERFLIALGAPDQAKPLHHYAAVFRRALESDGHPCLCGILASESGKLPDAVATALRAFSDQNIRWLESALQTLHPKWSPAKRQETAITLFSSLEGAMIFASFHSNPNQLKQVSENLINLFG